MMTPAEQLAPDSPTKGSRPPIGFLARLPDTWAIVFGHLAMVLFGLLLWGTERVNGPYRLLSGEPEREDVQQLVKYFPAGFVALFLAVYGLSWWLARRDKVTGFRPALASFCRLLWPACFGLLMLPVSFVPLQHEDFYGLILLPVAALITIFLAWQFLEWRGKETAQADRGNFRAWGGAVLALVLAYLAWFSYLSIRRHLTIGSNLHDFGIYDQLMWNTINGRPFECAMFRLEWIGYEIHKFDNHFFAEHFIPTYWITAPFYWLFPSSLTVFIAQTFMIAAAGVPAFLIAWKKLQNAPLAFLLTFLLLGHPHVQQANIIDVHVDTYAMVFLLTAFAAFLYGRHVIYWIALVLALGCKQELAINVTVLGVFLFFQEKERRKTAIGTFALGAGWFLLAAQVVIPHFRNGLPMRQFERYGHFIPTFAWQFETVITPKMVVMGMVENPVRTLRIILDPVRLRSLISLIAPFGFLMIFTRWAWLWLLPIAALHIMSGIPVQHEIGMYYGITLMPAVFVGSIYGATWLLRRDLQPENPLPRRRLLAATGGLLLVAIFIWNVYGYGPLGGRFRPRHYKMQPREQVIHDYLEAIPPDAVVSAHNRLGAQLAQRRYVYTFPEVVNEGEGVTEYIFLDTRGSSFPLHREEPYFEQTVRDVLESEEWGLILPNHDGLLLFKRGHPKDEHPVDFSHLDFTPYRKGRL